MSSSSQNCKNCKKLLTKLDYDDYELIYFMKKVQIEVLVNYYFFHERFYLVKNTSFYLSLSKIVTSIYLIK